MRRRPSRPIPPCSARAAAGLTVPQALVALMALSACSGGAAAPGAGAASQGTDGAAGAAEAPGPAFDAARAWGDLMAQVELGPRPSGSAALEETRQYLEQELRHAGLTPVRETFLAVTPLGEVEMANVYADLEAPAQDGQPAPTVIFCSHYDTKRFDGHPDPAQRAARFVGANDGASSTAVVLELARALAAAGPRAVTYRFLFVDGEEALRWTWNDPDNRYGSRHHAEALKKRGAHRQVKAAVVIDMVGDRDLQLTRDQYSTRDLLELFYAAAQRIGEGQIVGRNRNTVLDDHLSFLAVGIPACDLIDLEYFVRDERGWRNVWHTAEDTPEHCSQESLDAIGRTVLAALPALEAYARR